VLFPRDAPRDARNFVVDALIRGELFVKPVPWMQLAAGLDGRVNSYDQVERSWRVDLRDRGVKRPALAVRRLTVTFVGGPLTIDLGKQFIRWGKTDIVTPTDRLAPRDFLNPVDSEFLGVTGARVVTELGSNSLEAVWVPFLTPSRIPLLAQRWTAVPGSGDSLALIDASGALPKDDQIGVRLAHTSPGFEYALSYFDGFNSLPNIDIVPGAAPEIAIARSYPRLRTFGADMAAPFRWFTLKAESAYFLAPSAGTDEYVMVVAQVERQTGEWLLIGGYAGETVTKHGDARAFAPDRALARSLVARASYTVDVNRSLALEGTIRQSGKGAYAKAEYSQARGSHWRGTVTGVIIGGDDSDFLGRYRRNSHLSASLRYSF
jgi:hypothetical protein